MDKNVYLIDLSESDKTEFGRQDITEQSPSQQVFSAIWILESEVNNGGFEQYFRNASLAEVDHAARALRAIGAHQCAAIVDEAVGLLPSGQADRCAAIDSLSEDVKSHMEMLDSRFFTYPDNLTDLLFNYVSTRPETFGPAPDLSA